MTITLHGDDVARRAGHQAALPADRRAQGPGRHRRADRPARAGPGQDPGDRREPRRGRSSSSSCRKAGSSTCADGSVIVEATGTESEVDAFVALVRDLRHQGVGPHRGRRHGPRLADPSRRRSSDDGADVLRQRRRSGGPGRPDGRDHRLRQPGPRPRPEPPRVGRRRRRRARADGSKSRALAEEAGLRVTDVRRRGHGGRRDHDPRPGHRPEGGLRRRDRAEPAAGPAADVRPRLQHPLRADRPARRSSTSGWSPRRAPATSSAASTRPAAACRPCSPSTGTPSRHRPAPASSPTPGRSARTRAGVLETTFAEETETDLFGEQSVLCGGTAALVKMAFETLVEAGYQPELAYFETMHELKLIVDLMYRGGLNFMRFSVSDTAEYGDYVVRAADHRRARPGDDAGTSSRRSRTASFAARWIAENESGRAEFERLRAADRDHQIEQVGARLRAQMPFLNPVEVQAGQAQAAADARRGPPDERPRSPARRAVRPRGHRPHLRHDPARRRAGARRRADRRREARGRPPARPAQGRRHRGRLPGRLARRLRGGPADRPGDAGRDRGRRARPLPRRRPAAGDRGDQGRRAAAPPRLHRDERHPPQAQAPASTARQALAEAVRWVRYGREQLGRDAEIEFSRRGRLADRPRLPAPGLRGGRRGRRLHGQHPRHGRLRDPGRVRRARRAGRRPGRRARRPSASTATTTSASRRPTRWPPSRPARARSRSRSTASASGPATRRSRRSSWPSGRGRPSSPTSARGVADRADHRGQPPGQLPDRLRRPAEQGDRRRQRLRPRVGDPPGRRDQEPADLRDHDPAVGRAVRQPADDRQAVRPARPPGQAPASSATSSRARPSTRSTARRSRSPTPRRRSPTPTCSRSSSSAPSEVPASIALDRLERDLVARRQRDRARSRCPSTARSGRPRRPATARSTRSSARSTTRSSRSSAGTRPDRVRDQGGRRPARTPRARSSSAAGARRTRARARSS